MGLTDLKSCRPGHGDAVRRAMQQPRPQPLFARPGIASARRRRVLPTQCRVVYSATRLITVVDPEGVHALPSPFQRCILSTQIGIFTVLLSGTVSAGASYVTARISHRRQQRRASENYKLALVSEIRALHKHLIRYQTEFDQRVLTGRATAAQVLKVLLQPGDTIVFTNNASAIGLFDHQTALRVLRFYSDVRTLHGHAQALSELAGDEGREVIERELLRHEALLGHARRRAHALVKRLKRPSLAAVTLAFLRRRRRERGPPAEAPAPAERKIRRRGLAPRPEAGVPTVGPGRLPRLRGDALQRRP